MKTLHLFLLSILASVGMVLYITIFDLIVLLGVIQGISMSMVLYFITAKNQGKSLFVFILLITPFSFLPGYGLFPIKFFIPDNPD